MSTESNQPRPQRDESGETEHPFAPDIPIPPPPPPLPELLDRAPSQHATHSDERGRTPMGDTARAWGIAMDFVVTVIGLALVGYFADRYLKSSPTWTVVGLGAGFAFALYKIIRRTLADEKREATARGGSAAPRRRPPAR